MEIGILEDILISCFHVSTVARKTLVKEITRTFETAPVTKGKEDAEDAAHPKCALISVTVDGSQQK